MSDFSIYISIVDYNDIYYIKYKLKSIKLIYKEKK